MLMSASELGQSVFSRKVLSFSKILLCVMYVSVMLFAPQRSSSVGTTPDEFFEAPRRKDEGGIFAIPEILVILHPTILGSLMDVEVVRLERWEHIYGTVGYVAGFVKRDDQDGRLKMCACTKYTNILSGGTKSDMDRMRREEIEKMTDFSDLELDKRIEAECDNAGTYKGCVDIVSGITPDACMFCNAFVKDEPSRVLPLAFSKQTYFDPGIRMLGVNNTRASQDVYTGVYGKYWERMRGVTHKFCQGAMKNAIWGATKCIMEARSKSTEPAGYTVYRADDSTICMHGKYDDGRTSLDCVPIPQLKRPLLEARSNAQGLKIKFPECKDRNGADTKYCNLEMNLGEKDEDVGFSVIKPKIDDQYNFKKVQKCRNGAGNGGSCYYEYENDPNGNVTCVTGLKYARKKYYVRRNGRYHWVSELPKVLTARAYDPTARRYVQCPDNKSIDLSKISQNLIDTMTIRGNTYHMPQSNRKSPGKSPCDGDVSYVHSNYRLLRYSGTCRIDDRESVHDGYCRTQYMSLDDYEPFFLNEGESYSNGSVVPLDDMLQGLCVSNFPSHEYKYNPADDRGNNGVNRHILNIAKDNTSCDFLKIEMWGGGESGSLAANKGAGKPGTYVMGILKVGGNEGKHLLINVGRGGTISSAGTGDVQVSGKNTTVSLCSDYGARSCTVKLVAKGGGAHDVQSSGHQNLLHYRVSEGKSKIAVDEVFIPYQGEEDNTEGSIYAGKVGCDRGNASDIRNVQVVVQSAFRGAGGCADKLKRIVQSGADGAVRLTCEKWSGSAGAVKNWSASLCDAKFMSHLEKLREHSVASNLSSAAVEFFGSIATEKFCEMSSFFPNFTGAIENLHSLMSDKDSTKNVNLSSRRSISWWINSKVDQLVKALDSEGEILGTYIRDFAQDKSSTRDQAREKFVSSFKELVRTKVPTYASVKDIVQYADAIERHARKHNTKVAGIFDALKKEEMAKAASENSELVGFLRELVHTLSKGSVTFEHESEFDSWTDGYKKRLQKILSEDNEVTSIYINSEHSIAAQKGNPKIVEQTIHDIAHGLKDVIKGEVVLKYVSANIRKSVDTLKQQANNQKLASHRVFSRLSSGSFLKSVLDKQEFLDAVEAISNAVGITGNAVVVQTKAEKEQWIESKIAPLGAALDKDTKVISEYKRIQGNPAISDAQAKKELLDAFRELLDQKVVIDHKGMLQTLESIKKRAQDSGVESHHVRVLDRLLSDEVAKAVVKSDAVRSLLENISNVKEHSNVFNGKEYRKEEFKQYMQKASADQEVANFIRNTLKVSPQALEESFGAFVEKIVAKKKSVPSYDIGEAVLAILHALERHAYAEELLDAVFRPQIREIVQENACFVGALYAMANAYTTVKATRETFHWEFLSENAKNDAKELLGRDILECIRRDRSLADKLSQFIPIFYSCSTPELCMKTLVVILVDMIDRIPKHGDLKDGIMERIKELFESSWRAAGRRANAADIVLHMLTGGDDSWRCYSENTTVVYLMEKLIRTRARQVTHYYCANRRWERGTIAKRLHGAIRAHWRCNDVFTRESISYRGYRPDRGRGWADFERECFNFLEGALNLIEETNFTMAANCGDSHKLTQNIRIIADGLRSKRPELASLFDIMLSDRDLLGVMADSGFQELFSKLKDIVTRRGSTADLARLGKEINDSLEHMHDNEQARGAVNAYNQHYIRNIDKIIKLSFVRSVMRDATSRAAIEFALNGMKDGYPYASTRVLYHAMLHAIRHAVYS